MTLRESGHRYAYTIWAWLGDEFPDWERVWSDIGTIYIYTGPFCVASYITPPDLLYPNNGAIFLEEEQSQDGFSPKSWQFIGGDSGGGYGNLRVRFPQPLHSREDVPHTGARASWFMRASLGSIPRRCTPRSVPSLSVSLTA